MTLRIQSPSSPALRDALLQSLVEAVKRHSNSPSRLSAAVDRVSFRLHGDFDELFAVCSCRDEHQPSTLWGLICESPPVAAGLLLRRLAVERLLGMDGVSEFKFSPERLASLEFALDEYPENIGLYEILARCSPLRESFGQRPDILRQAEMAFDSLRLALVAASPARLATDRGLVGLASGVYGVCDSDAFYLEADLICTFLDVLSARECQWHVASLASRSSDEVGIQAAAAARRLCLELGDACDRLAECPKVATRILGFLGSMLPHIYWQDEHASNAELWTLAHLVLSSRCVDVLMLVFTACGKSPMHDPADYVELRHEIFGRGRPKDALSIAACMAPISMRVIFCSALLLVFNLFELLNYSAGRPPLLEQSMSRLVRGVLLPPLQSMLDGALTSRWSHIRHGVRALVEAATYVPMLDRVQLASLRTAKLNFKKFAAESFVSTKGEGMSIGAAEALLDPYGHSHVAKLPALAYITASDAAAAEFKTPLSPDAWLEPRAGQNPTAALPWSAEVGSPVGRQRNLCNLVPALGQVDITSERQIARATTNLVMMSAKRRDEGARLFRQRASVSSAVPPDDREHKRTLLKAAWRCSPRSRNTHVNVAEPSAS